MTTAAKGTYAFVSLGCPKNLVDSERMLGKLAQDGYTLVTEASGAHGVVVNTSGSIEPARHGSPRVAEASGADVVVVNTCGFIEPARQESLGVIREMLKLKEEGKV